MDSGADRPSVLLISHGFPPNSIAGTEQHARAITSALGDRYRFRVLCRDARGSEEERAGMLVRLPLGAKAGSVDELVDARDPVFEAAILREVEDLRPDLAHVHHWLHLSHSIVGLLAARGIPVVVTLHDYYAICARADLVRPDGTMCAGPEGGRRCADCFPPPGAVFAGESLAHRAKRVLSARLGRGGAMRYWLLSRAESVFRARLDHMHQELERAAALICPSAALKREIASVWPDLDSRLSVLPHGIDTTWSTQVSRGPSERLRFAFVGSLTPHKGIELLLEAFRRVGQEAAELTLYGAWASPDPAFRERVTRIAAETGANLRGRYEAGDLPAIYSEVDVAVMPSTWKETAGLSVLEAFAAGVPVIASNLGGLPEAVADGKDGLLFRAGDVADLAQKMQELTRNQKLLAHLRANVRLPKSIAQYAAEIAGIYDSARARVHTDRAP